MITHFARFLLLFAAGAGIGFFFFGGLWWTVRRLATSGRPFFLTLSSFFVRTGSTLAALYCVMGKHWQRLIPALLGIMVIRFVMVRAIAHQTKTKQERSYIWL